MAATVIVADDQPELRELLAELISSVDSLRLVGLAADADEAIALALRHRPDVALVDCSMPGGGGAGAATGIAAVSPATRLVAYSGYSDRTSVLEMLRAGVSSYVVKGGPLEEVLDAVSAALRGQAHFSPEVAREVGQELSRELASRARTAAELSSRRDRIRSVLAGRLSVVFQPIVELETRKVVGYEALARVDAEPRRPPDWWLAEARAVGLRPELEAACVALALEHLDEVPQGAYLAVNVDPAYVDSDLVLAAINGADPTRLVVELTEHGMIEDYPALRKALTALRDRGVRIAIDDVGAGFASLRHVLQLAPEVVKIDGSLTRGVESDRSARAMTSALVAFTREIGQDAVSEAVETESQRECLLKLGIRQGQGFFLGRPARDPFCELWTAA
ncbi:MAG: EAL domain-containing protein [Gaiellaceae bacterium]